MGCWLLNEVKDLKEISGLRIVVILNKGNSIQKMVCRLLVFSTHLRKPKMGNCKLKNYSNMAEHPVSSKKSYIFYNEMAIQEEK